MNNGSFYKDSGGYANYTQKRKAKNNKPDSNIFGLIVAAIVIYILIKVFL